ncbi:MAG TPA: hypothetical protein VLF94_08630 [Chlamydiales bacterium]|nr:hypothetical protein [Chlamydiales bacterium]
MFKRIWISAASLMASPLLALTIQNVEIPFPPSNYEWKLLADEKTLDFSFMMPECDPDNSFKVFTHREGDALEIFIAAVFNDTDDTDEAEEETLETSQKLIDETINQYLPNHRLIANKVAEDDNGGFAEWEWNDGDQDVMHGFTRVMESQNEGGRKVVVLGYSTTALKSEYNRTLWTDVLNQAHLIEMQ